MKRMAPGKGVCALQRPARCRQVVGGGAATRCRHSPCHASLEYFFLGTQLPELFVSGGDEQAQIDRAWDPHQVAHRVAGGHCKQPHSKEHTKKCGREPAPRFESGQALTSGPQQPAPR